MEIKNYEGSAPGRLDVMGGIADYSGSLVLQMPIAQHTFVNMTLRDDGICFLESGMDPGENLYSETRFSKYLLNGQVNYAYAREQFGKEPGNAWIAYVLGCALVLQKEKGIVFKGASFKIRSRVPLGKGVSSSASLEIATMKALQKAYSISFAGTELARLAQLVENLVVGAPCGLMDQLACYFGEERKLLPIVCQPDLVKTPLVIPEAISFMGIDSGVRHSVQGAAYGQVRCAAFMGYSIIAKACGAGRDLIAYAVNSGDFSKLPYKGYLCNISVKEFEEKFRPILPGSMGGSEFIAQYGCIRDQVTQVDPATEYAVNTCTRHPVYENERTQRFMRFLQNMGTSPANDRVAITSMGQLMFESHESYSSCGLGAFRTNELVADAKRFENAGIAGAKITGGGSGGTVCLLAYGEEGKTAVQALHNSFCEKYKQALALF